MNPRVSIIIINWNGWQDTIECLNSVLKINYPHFDLIVVDNGSQDDSIEKLEEYSSELRLNSSGFVLIKKSKNYGFALGNNIGINYAMENLNPDYILLLNNDTVVDTYFLDQLVKTGEENPKNGIIGPVVYYYHQKHKISIYGGNLNLYTGLTSYPHLDTHDSGIQSEIDYISGCCLLIKKSAIEKVGLLKSNYFLYYEDVEWCYRVKKHDYRIIYQPAAKIFHKESPTAKNPTGVYYLTRNRWWFMKEYTNTIQYSIFFVLSLLYFLYHSLRLMKSRELSYALYNGMRDGIRGP
jgi:GT2 family glycosyltransferase